jgi:hypothetical protein
VRKPPYPITQYGPSRDGRKNDTEMRKMGLHGKRRLAVTEEV